MQVKKIIAVLLTVCLLFSLSVPAYAVDEVYNIADDVALAPVIYYTEDYYPGLLAQLRSSMIFANNRVAHGSFATMNYNPSIFYREGSTNYTIPFNSLTPYVAADQTDISGVYSIPRTTLLLGNMMIAYLPSTSDAYFDFQSSNIAFDQQDANANTFYINGTLTFNLRNLWNFSGQYETTSFYLASDPLAVQLLIDGKAYGDIIDVTGYTSPFTSLYGNAVPANASVTFNNLKVYYQGDTPDMVGFRVYTGSAFTDGQYNYNSGGEFVAVDVTNTVTMRFTDLPDITFVNEGGDGYAGDLSGIQSLLNSILSGVSGLNSLISGLFRTAAYDYFLNSAGNVASTQYTFTITHILSQGLLGLRSLMVNSSGKSFLSIISDNLTVPAGTEYLHPNGETITSAYPLSLSFVVSRTLVGLRAGQRKIQSAVDSLKSYAADTVFPWQSYNMQTHQLNTATNITGQNNLFFTAFQSIEDKLGRLAYVFGSDEDLALKDSADPGTDAFRENFGGGASLKDIGDAAELTTSVPQLMDSGFDFGDFLDFVGSDDDVLAWFSAETWVALDSTGNVAAADDDYLADYYENLQEVEDRRHWGE